MSLEEALAHVKGKRRIVNPNDGFIAQLQSYEGILRARYVAYMHVCLWIHVCLGTWCVRV